MWKCLTDLHEGESAEVEYLLNTGVIKRRLQDLGLVEGTNVVCLQKSPYGNPVAYQIRGAVIALRVADASMVIIR